MNFEKVIAERKTKTVYKDNGKTIKLFIENYSKSDILNEALNHARIEETGLNVPKLLEVTKINNRWAIVYEYIEGKTLEELMNENPDKKDEYIKMFVDVQTEILSKKAPLLNRLKEKMKTRIESANIDENIKYELYTRLEGMPKHYKVCHGDFNPSNVVIKEDGQIYVLDWAHSTQGNASADAARTYLLFWMDKKEEEAKEYLNIFSEKTGIRKENVLKWIPIVAAAQLAKCNEEEKEFLSNWIDVIEYQ